MEKMKPSFLNRDRALLTAMIKKEDPQGCKTLIRNCAAAGADAYGIQLCGLKREFRNENDLRSIFSFCGSKPIYVTDYHYSLNGELSDDEIFGELLLSVKCGATLADIMGDMFCADELGITYEHDAVEKQRAAIQLIHENGGEVLMSTHTFRYLSTSQVLDIAKAQEERGADIVKIVTAADTEEELLSNFNTMLALKKELSVPFLFLTNGKNCRLQRVIGPYFGSCMVLCVYEYESNTTLDQPILRSIRQVMDNIDWEPYRE